jgi:hypothetical protein
VLMNIPRRTHTWFDQLANHAIVFSNLENYYSCSDGLVVGSDVISTARLAASRHIRRPPGGGQ